jgi:hypothetical protein
MPESPLFPCQELRIWPQIFIDTKYTGPKNAQELLFFFSSSGLKASAGILEQSAGARNRVGIGLSYRPTSLHRLAGRYDNSVHTLFLPPIDCSKLPALIGLVYVYI